jgi:Glycosyltransferase family 87
VRLRNLAYWSAVAACLELAAGELIGWLRFALTGNLRGPDFYAYYAISLLLLHRGPRVVYDYGVQKQFQDQVTAQWGGQFYLLPHILPPWVTLVFYPLALLPYRAAYIAWGVSIVLLVGLAIWLLLGAAGLRGRAALLAAAAAAASLPVTVLLLQGQSDALMLAALAAAAFFAVRGRHRSLTATVDRPARLGSTDAASPQGGWGVAAGGFVALALVKPQLMLLLPAWLLVRRAWWALAAFLGGSVLLVAISLVTFGWAAVLQWIRILTPWAFAGGGGFSVDTQSRYSLRGLLQLLGLPLAAQVAVLIACLLGLTLLLWRSRADARVQIALALCGSFALSPYQHAHDLSLLLVPGLLLAGARPVLRHPRAGGWLLLAGWLGLELLILVPLLTAATIVAVTAFLAWECLPVAAAGQETVS